MTTTIFIICLIGIAAICLVALILLLCKNLGSNNKVILAINQLTRKVINWVFERIKNKNHD